MCVCGKPTVNGEPGYSWNGEPVHVCPVNPPTLSEHESLVYDAPGRCGEIDAHCHHFRIVVDTGARLSVLVRHGGGQERFDLPRRAGLPSVHSMTSDEGYWFLHALYGIYKEATTKARDEERHRWVMAAFDKRIKIRKRGGISRVEILPKVTIG